jgi:hypothetical protein
MIAVEASSHRMVNILITYRSIRCQILLLMYYLLLFYMRENVFIPVFATIRAISLDSVFPDILMEIIHKSEVILYTISLVLSVIYSTVIFHVFQGSLLLL